MVIRRIIGRALQSAFLLTIALLFSAAQGTPMSLFDTYTANQASQQAAGKLYTGKLTLDFAPFEPAIRSLSPERIAELDRLLHAIPVSALQALLASGATTSVELSTYYLERIQRIDVDRFNTILELNPQALAIAASLDAERAAGQVRGPLHGIPVTLKANIATGDHMHTSAGAYALKDAIADRDAFLVTQLREAGMVILGKNNLSEWANYYAMRSVNGFSVLGGFTRNPHGQFDVGGSSSGSCASVWLGLTPLSVGSETTGSIVYPASQNGVVGLKPSVGLISRDRIIPISDAFDTAGPIGRSVADVALLMTALTAHNDPTDPASMDVAALIGFDFSTNLSADALQGIRVGVVLRGEPLRSDDDKIRVQVVERLRAAGALVIDIPAMSEFAGKDQDDALQANNVAVLSYGYHLGLEAYLASQGERVPVHTLDDLIAFNEQDSSNRVPFGQELIGLSASASAEQLAGYPELAARTRDSYAALVRAALAAHDVAFIADFSNYASPYHSRSGFPALTIPAGTRDSGEPLGVTFFGDRLADHDLLRYGFAFEAHKLE